MKEITEDHCDFETAKLLMEKGFDEKTDFVFYYYEEDDGWTFEKLLPGDKFDKDKMIHCPTQALAMKWLREVHNICISVDVKIGGGKYYVCISSTENGLSHDVLEDEVWDTFEKACEVAIKYCLENLV